jgi:hypothetical protein
MHGTLDAIAPDDGRIVVASLQTELAARRRSGGCRAALGRQAGRAGAARIRGAAC